MSRRWIVWSVGLFALALGLLLPLRIALDLAAIERTGIAARGVFGSVWSGRMSDVVAGDQPLGTFDVGLNPFAALVGHVALGFDRVDSSDGPLVGRLRSGGGEEGIVGVTGRMSAGGLFAPLPVEAVEFTDATILFDRGRCVRASGKVTALVGARIAGLDLSRGLVGTLSCDGERARIAMVSDSRLERVDLTIAADGTWRAMMRVDPGAPDLAAALALAGFTPSGGGMGLSVDGHF